MNRQPGFRVDEIRGRLLHEALLAEAKEQIGLWCDGSPVVLPPHQEPPAFPLLVKTDTDTDAMRAVVVAV